MLQNNLGWVLECICHITGGSFPLSGNIWKINQVWSVDFNLQQEPSWQDGQEVSWSSPLWQESITPLLFISLYQTPSLPPLPLSPGLQGPRWHEVTTTVSHPCFQYSPQAAEEYWRQKLSQDSVLWSQTSSPNSRVLVSVRCAICHM